MITVVGNLKGGTGKSTVTFNIAIWLVGQHHSVEVFDLDPQATLCDVADIRHEDGYDPQLNVSNRLPADFPPEHEILIDVGTADMAALKDAVSRADRVVIPIPPSQADIWSTQRFMGIIRETCEGGKQPQLLGLINRADTHHAVRETDEAEEALRALEDIQLLDVRLHQRLIYRRAFSEGLAVFELEPRSKASREVETLASILYPSL